MYRLIVKLNINYKNKNKMKKLFIIVIALIGLSVNAQEKPFIVEHVVDKMTKKEYYLPIEDLIISNKEKNKGFRISPNLKFQDGKLKLKTLIVKSFVGGSCVENNKLYVLLENDEVITLTSWNKFNCERTSYFDFTEEDLQLLSESKIKLIRFVNGRDYEQFEKTPNTDQKDYFVRVLTNSKIVEVK
jgi:hypothetical protein